MSGAAPHGSSGSGAPPAGGGRPDGPAPKGARRSLRPVLLAGELRPGEVRRVEVDGRALAIWNAKGELFATDDTCTHEQASLSEGDFDPDGAEVACPRHGARFDLRTGRALTLPAYRPLATYAVRVEDGRILIELP